MVALMARSLVLTEIREERRILLPPRPLTFEEFVALFGEDEAVELVDGMVIPIMAAKDIHEDLFRWLLFVLVAYVEAFRLGIVRGSRTPVRISLHRARLPDLLFVRAEHADIVQEDGIFGTPDLIVEILSPTDTPSRLLALEADYRSIGVPEMWFVDLTKKQVRVLWRRDGDYEVRVMRKGVLRSRVIDGFWLRIEWLFQKPLPNVWETVQRLLGSAPLSR
jgi:Uma2 family endonuclease